MHRLLEDGCLTGVSVVPCCREDEAVVISAGLHICGKVPVAENPQPEVPDSQFTRMDEETRKMMEALRRRASPGARQGG